MIGGIEIRSSPYATRRVLRAERMPIQKRRKAWRLVWRDEPAAIMCGDNLCFVHPDLIEKMKRYTK